MDRLVQKAVDDQRVTIWVNTTHGSTETLSNYLLNAGWGVSGGLICFVHANDTAARQAAETKSSVQSADSVASYSILFETSSLPKTKILHTSACLLIQEALADPLLSRYSVVIIAEYHLRTLETLSYPKWSTSRVSQETANQRTRIAGLSSPGKCYRLYPQDKFDNFQKTETPEIQRVSLDRSILQLKSLGVDNILRFDYLSPPLTSMVAEALDRLVAIGAMNERAELTNPFGEHLAQLPLKLLHGAMVLRSLERGCFDQIISLIAVRLSKGEFFDHEKSRLFVAQEGDDITWLNIYEGFIKSGSAPARGNWCQKHGLNEQRLLKAVDIRNQLLRILQHRGIKTAKSELATSTTITQCIADVYKHNSAFRVSNGLFRTTIGSLEVRIHPSSVLYNRNPGFIVFEEVVENDGKLFVKDITTIQRDQISER
ncbi:hypothetical protein TWF192_009191 [Orbilia oligospora]|nr:hypothetical protein TWF192_009191 [Orbilia oligospora]